jgi:hypothetical protein
MTMPGRPAGSEIRLPSMLVSCSARNCEGDAQHDQRRESEEHHKSVPRDAGANGRPRARRGSTA